MKQIVYGLLCTLCLYCQQTYAERYLVTFKGIEAGQAELLITRTTNNYQAKLALYPVLLAKLSGIDDMVESASGEIRHGHFYPSNYRRTNKEGSALLYVGFAQQSAKVIEGNEEKIMEIDPMGQDPLSQIAQIQHDLRNKNLQESYYLVTENNQRQYRATQNGQQVTLIEQPSKRRQLILQFDENFVLVSMQKRKRGKVQFSMQKMN